MGLLPYVVSVFPYDTSLVNTMQFHDQENTTSHGVAAAQLLHSRYPICNRHAWGSSLYPDFYHSRRSQYQYRAPDTVVRKPRPATLSI